MFASALPLGPNQSLIGEPQSRYRLMTPALVLDLDRLEQNIAAMAAHCRRVGVALRPHAKTHKSVTIAGMQLAAGAVGISCATLGEAEAMAAGGIGQLLLTSPVIGEAKLARLAALNKHCAALLVVADNPENLPGLAAAGAASGRQLAVLVDFDIGLHRTGTANLEAALALAEQISITPGLAFAGLQAYAGQLQHVEDYARRRELARVQYGKLAGLRRALAQRGLPPGITTGGGTGTYEIDALEAVFSELQAGSYVFMDVDYDRIQLRAHANARPFENALLVRTSVVSTNARGFVTTDAGLKRFATDGPLPVIAAGAPPGATYRFQGDEHGAVVFVDPAQRLALGAGVECVVPHCDPTVNLYAHYHCVRGERLVDIWPVDARGAI